MRLNHKRDNILLRLGCEWVVYAKRNLLKACEHKVDNFLVSLNDNHILSQIFYNIVKSNMFNTHVNNFKKS